LARHASRAPSRSGRGRRGALWRFSGASNGKIVDNRLAVNVSDDAGVEEYTMILSSGLTAVRWSAPAPGLRVLPDKTTFAVVAAIWGERRENAAATVELSLAVRIHPSRRRTPLWPSQYHRACPLFAWVERCIITLKRKEEKRVGPKTALDICIFWAQPGPGHARSRRSRLPLFSVSGKDGGDEESSTTSA